MGKAEKQAIRSQPHDVKYVKAVYCKTTKSSNKNALSGQPAVFSTEGYKTLTDTSCMSNNKQEKNVIIKSRIFCTFIGQFHHMTAPSYMNNNANTKETKKKK